MQGMGRQFVYVVGPGDSVVARDVVTGSWNGSLWIIDKGLSAGDRVIVEGTQKVAPGRVVKPVPLVDSSRRTMTEPRYFFIRRPIFGAVISIVITLLGLFAIRLLADRALSADHAAGRAHRGEFPGRVVGRRGAGSRRADRGTARRSSGHALLLVDQLGRRDANIAVTFDISRNQDLAAVDVQNAVKLAEPQLPDAVRTNGITILKANTDILGDRRAAVERSAVRRDVSRQLHEAVRRRRD